MSAEISLECEGAAKLALSDVELSRVFDLVLAEEGVERICCVSVSVVSPKSMQELNRDGAPLPGACAPSEVVS